MRPLRKYNVPIAGNSFSLISSYLLTISKYPLRQLEPLNFPEAMFLINSKSFKLMKKSFQKNILYGIPMIQPYQ